MSGDDCPECDKRLRANGTCSCGWKPMAPKTSTPLRDPARPPLANYVPPTDEQIAAIKRANDAMRVTLAIPYAARRDPEAPASPDKDTEAWTLSPAERMERSAEQRARYQAWRRAHGL